MPNRSDSPGRRDDDGMTGYSGNPSPIAMSEQESTDRSRIEEAYQWLGLLDVDDHHLAERAADRPLGQSLLDLDEIERTADNLADIADRLRALRSDPFATVVEKWLDDDEKRGPQHRPTAPPKPNPAGNRAERRHPRR